MDEWSCACSSGQPCSWDGVYSTLFDGKHHGRHRQQHRQRRDNYGKDSVCFGMCPAYEVAVYGNGTVVYEGFDFVAVEGRQTSQISKEQVNELVSQFYKNGFFSLRDRYEEQVTDLPSTMTSISIDGAKKSVYRYGFTPENLIELEDRIDKIAGTAKWVKGEK